MTLTDRLRAAITESGIPLLALAKQTGVQRRSLGRFAAGETSLRLDKADILAEYFGIEIGPARKGRKHGARL